MTARPAVSSVITTFHRPDGLRRALTSVCAQPVDGHEVIVVNDAGPDVSAIVAAAARPVRLITLPENRGLAVARKVGVAAARGEFVAFLDDDDVWLPTHLPTALDALGTSSVDAVYTTCLVAHELAEPGREVRSRYRFAVPFDAQLLAVTNLTPVISVVARRFDAGDPMLHPHGAIQEDWAMWLGLVRGRGWRLQHVDVPTAVYHRVPSATSMTGAAAATTAGIRRFAAGHRRLHQRWPVHPSSPAGRGRWMPHRMYDLVHARHAAGLPVDPCYYERCLPVIAAALAGQLNREDAETALAAAVAPDIPGPRTPDSVSATSEEVSS
ncbi:glycosyltransferase family 2 protein [Actinoplanes sp. NPDC051859]|uniref:glycosyltransferase family 2 protein n=1 Tax=Actinoplanes sp. NPDC051859 TaxID=3363909 RepID=UPI003799194E